MARHAQPREAAALKGADRNHPERYKTEVPKSAVGLGLAPDHLTVESKACWFELETFGLQGVLTGADRFILEVTANLLAEYRKGPEDFTAAKIEKLVGCLARLGLSPADRQKLGKAAEEKGNPFNEF